MNHNIGAGIGPIFKARFFLVEVIGIIDAKRQVKATVRIEGSNLIKAFGHLFVAFAKFGAEQATRAKNGIGLEELPIAFAVGDPNLKNALLFEPDQQNFLGWIIYTEFAESRFEAMMNDITEFLEAIFDVFLARGGASNC